jgi:hypothetical protein
MLQPSGIFEIAVDLRFTEERVLSRCAEIELLIN